MRFRRNLRASCARLSIFLAVALLEACSGGGKSGALPDVMQSSNRSAGASFGRAATDGSSAYDAAVLGDAPNVFYRMADTTSVMADNGSRGVNGAYGSSVRLGSATFAARSGPAPTFPGGNTFNNNAVATVAPSASLQPAQISVEAWVTLSEINASGFFMPIVAYGSEGAGNPYILQISPENTLNFWSKSTSSASAVQGSTYLSPGQTYHVVATDNGSQLALYVDGKLDATASASGQPSYTFLNNFGLTIGGAADSVHRAIVGGSIDDVAIYPKVLSQSTVAAHYALGSSAGWPYESEVPRSADGFVDSFGLVLHLHYQNSPYDLQFENVKALLGELGVRHIRDGVYIDGWQPYKDRLEELAQIGIRSSLDAPANTTPAQLIGYPALIPGSVEAFAGLNEPDISGDPNWIADTRAWQKLLYQTVKSNAATSSIAILGPSMVTSEAAQAIGDMSQWMDYGNAHVYFTARNPETPGFGGAFKWGAYGSLEYTLGYETLMSGTRPERISETGWGTQTNGWHDVSLSTQAKYLARLYLDLYGRGIDRSTMYELIDGQDGEFGWFGLVDYNLNRKPSFNEMKGLIGLLADPGSAVSPSSKFNFHFSGNTSNLNHLVLQKRDGRRYLAFWLGVQSCDPIPAYCADQNITSQQITLSTQVSPSASTLHTFDGNGNISSKKINFASSGTELTASDQVSVLELDP